MQWRVCQKCAAPKPLTLVFFKQTARNTWGRNCRACVSTKFRAADKKKPGEIGKRARLYQQRKSDAGGYKLTSPMKASIRINQRDSCGYCASRLFGAGEFDHIIPVSRGGPTIISNLMLACRSCNRDKGSMTGSEFIAWCKSIDRQVLEKDWQAIEAKISKEIKDIRASDARNRAILGLSNVPPSRLGLLDTTSDLP